MSRSSWKGAVRRTAREFKADNITDWAAALTYYGVLAIFPALVALVSIVGLMGTSASDSLSKNLSSFAPGPAKTIIGDAIHNLAASRSGAGILFLAGTRGAPCSAPGYIAAFMRAANAIWSVVPGRPV